MNLSSSLSTLRLLGFMEGCSFLLFGLTMPVKYILHEPLPNKIIGYAHGFLFIAYILFVFIVSRQQKWSVGTQFGAYIASLIPFGTFIADAKIFKPTSLKA